MYFLKKETQKNASFIEENKADLCASIQSTIVSILLKKIETAAKENGIQEIAIAGGVSANSGLRQAMLELGERNTWKIYIPKFEYCTDNAAMIAIAGKYMLEKGWTAEQSISAQARLPM